MILENLLSIEVFDASPHFFFSAMGSPSLSLCGKSSLPSLFTPDASILSAHRISQEDYTTGRLPLSQGFLSSNLGMVYPNAFCISPSVCATASKINVLKIFLTMYLLLLLSHNVHHQKSVKDCQD